MMRLVREDTQGLFVKTGGYTFQPLLPTIIITGVKVPALHQGGTPVAKVGDELWANTESMTEIDLIIYKNAFTVHREKQDNK